jgi:hypothetical protein
MVFEPINIHPELPAEVLQDSICEVVVTSDMVVICICVTLNRLKALLAVAAEQNTAASQASLLA